MDSTTQRYAPMYRVRMPCFSNRIPYIDWQTNLPKFIDGNEDEAIRHLIKFHWHIHKLRIRFHKDCLIKKIMATLEGKGRSWYEGLKPHSLFSLKEFHTTFFEFYRKSHHSFLLFEYCCESRKNFIQYLEETFGDEESLDYEIIEALYEFSFQQQYEEANHFDTRDHTQHTVASSLIDEKIVDEYCLDAHKDSPQKNIMATTQHTE